jgi:hypothetical protein
MNKTLHRFYVGSFFLIGIAVSVLLAVNGFEYYSTVSEERFFHHQHELLKPSGPAGHGFGIVGTLMMILGVSIYMIRKRVRKLFNIGYLKHWLEFHIFLCTVGPVLVLYHTAFKFGGIVSVSFWSMTAVVLSGVFGRFIYARIPRTLQGKELDIEELNRRNEDLTIKLRSEFSIDGQIISRIEKISASEKYKNIKLSSSLSLFLKDYFEIMRVLNQIKKEIRNYGVTRKKEKEILKIVKSKLIIARRIGWLKTMQKLFKYWHIVHLPFAIVMFVIMLIHVAVTIIFGYKWIF